MGKYNFLSYEELMDSIESKLTDNNYKETADMLLSAIYEWPAKGLNEPNDFIRVIKNEINGPLTYDNLAIFRDKLDGEIEDDADKICSFEYLTDMFDYDKSPVAYESLEIETIINSLSNYWRALKLSAE